MLTIHSSVVIFWPITLYSPIWTQQLSPKQRTHIAEHIVSYARNHNVNLHRPEKLKAHIIMEFAPLHRDISVLLNVLPWSVKMLLCKRASRSAKECNNQLSTSAQQFITARLDYIFRPINWSSSGPNILWSFQTAVRN